MTETRRPLVLTIVLALLMIFVVTLVQGRAYRAQVTMLRQQLYAGCMSREPYDAKSQQARQAFRDYYASQILIEAHNRFIDQPLRDRRVADARRLVASLDTVLASTPVARCASLKP